MKNDLVVCISTDKAIGLVLGEIYTVTKVMSDFTREYYELLEDEKYYHWVKLFRPVDTTFGEVVAEIIEKQVEVEQFETVNN